MKEKTTTTTCDIMCVCCFRPIRIFLHFMVNKDSQTIKRVFFSTDLVD